MNIFVSFASQDRKYVDSFINESYKYKKNDLWVSYQKKIPPGSNFKNYINNAIDDSDGAILLVSRDFLSSEFINEIELPRILEKAKNPKYKLAVVLIDDCEYEDNKQLKNIQFINSPSKPLFTSSIREYSEIIENTFDSFKKSNKRNPLFPIIIFGMVLSFIFINFGMQGSIFESSSNPGDIRDCGDFTSGKEAQDWFDLYYEDYGDISKLDGDGDLIACESLNKGEEAFNSKINSQITEEDFGYLSQITDKKYFELGTWVCEAMDSGIPHYLINKPLFIEMALEVQDMGAGGREISKLNFYEAVNYVIYASNTHLCKKVYDTAYMEENVALMLYLTNGAEYRSNFYKYVFGGLNYNSEIDNLRSIDRYENELLYYLDNPNENIPDKLYRDFAYINDQVNELRNGCRLLDENDSVEVLVPFMQEAFDGVESIESQHILMDIFEIQFTIVPQLYCANNKDLGVSASTWIYLVSFKFDPLIEG